MSPDPPSFCIHASVHTQVQLAAGPMQFCFCRGWFVLLGQVQSQSLKPDHLSPSRQVISRHELLTNQILLFNFQAVATPWLSWALRPSLTFLECERWSDLIDIFPTCLAKKKFPSRHNKQLPPVLCYSVSWSGILWIVHCPGRFQPLSTTWRIPFCGPFPCQIKASRCWKASSRDTAVLEEFSSISLVRRS